ncbi:hypothetical protein [Vreelandella aquamarina]|uniref:hypothetical protein n=1 Tax=Vreelandella aquamarina TaxID=77097 RepID=UPI001D18012F|nr:hypothetical protein [Halomonas meridiana]MCC4289180.1 hypothetical protein [Halomonas meridiana]
MSNNTPEVQPIIRTDSVSDVPVAHNERLLSGMTGSIIFLACVLFTSMHLYLASPHFSTGGAVTA